MRLERIRDTEKRTQKHLRVGVGAGLRRWKRQVALGRLETAVAPSSHIPWILSALTETHPASFSGSPCSDHPHSAFPPGNGNESIS